MSQRATWRWHRTPINWKLAIEEVLHALAKNETWDLVDVPQGVKSIRCSCVYKVKYNVENSINRYKARLVAKGYAPTHDIDYNDTFTPVAKMVTICVLLAITTAKG